jgi:RNA polymerase sigma factor (sigma-70 family)
VKHPNHRTDDELLADRRPGTAGTAFASFYGRHERAVLAYFVRRVRSAELAADLAAETFAQALASRRRYKPRPKGSAIAWLFGIAHHVLARSARRGRVEDRARRRLGLDPLALDDEQIEAIERLSDIAEALRSLERLPAEQREAIRARILEEDSYADIAARLQCSQAVVRQRVSRGLAALRRDLEETA